MSIFRWFAPLALGIVTTLVAQQPAAESKAVKQQPPAGKPAAGTPKAQPDKAKAKAPARNPLAPIDDVAGLPRVLLIGDSISMGYTLPTRELLKGVANVHRPPTNCGPTTLGVKQIDAWLGKGKWDVIHFNWGLHDIKFMNDQGTLVDVTVGKQQVSIEEYEKNLRALVAKLKATGAKLVWRNTTPVPEGAKGRIPGDEVKYNEIAAKIMAEEKIPTHDLYGYCKPRLAEIQNRADVHFNAAGNTQLAGEVARIIREQLESK